MRLRILVVDDNETVLQLIAELLTSEFDVVGTANDGVAMISAAETLNPDIIVADIEMPRLNGIEATRSVLKSKPTQLVIMLTMHTNAALAHRALDSGARGYVHKQRAGDELLPAIQSALQGATFISPACGLTQ